MATFLKQITAAPRDEKPFCTVHNRTDVAEPLKGALYGYLPANESKQSRQQGLRSAIVEHTGDTEFKLQWWGPYISEDGGTLRFTQTARRATRVLVCTAMVRSANEQPQSQDLQQGENMLATSRTVFICI